RCSRRKCKHLREVHRRAQAAERQEAGDERQDESRRDGAHSSRADGPCVDPGRCRRMENVRTLVRHQRGEANVQDPPRKAAKVVLNFRVAAPKWCKALQITENRTVSVSRAAFFHKLINTCVENFTEQKYLQRDSATLVPSAGSSLGF